MLTDLRPVPESLALSSGQYDLVLYFEVVAGFGLLASSLWSLTSRSEIGARYRPAVLASMCITAIAALSYLFLVVKWDSGYVLQDNLYRPTAEARLTQSPRYMDWSVTVPLLTAELLAVCSISGSALRRLRTSTMAAAFLMILTGFIGAKVIDDGANVGARVLWGLISTVFLCYLYPALIHPVRRSLSTMSADAGRSLTAALTLLLGTFVIYPLVYAIPVFFDPTPRWTVAMHVAFSVADLTAKVGFGALVHRVAKLRTAEDVTAGVDTHPESVWVSHLHCSEAVQPAIQRHEHPTTPR
jgi:bacteriorhodopsin